MSGEKVKGERVCGSSAEGSTHHRCTSGPKKGGGPIILRRGSTYLGGGGGAGVSANDTTSTNIISFLSLSEIRSVYTIPSNPHNVPVCKRKIPCFHSVVSTFRKTKQNFT